MAVPFAAGVRRLIDFARRAVREGVGVTRARNALREGGLSFSNQSFSDAYAVARREAVVRAAERSADLTTRPGAPRIVRGPWGFSEKWGQVVKLNLRDVTTGAGRDWDIVITTDRLLTRQEAIDMALDRVLPSIAEYGQEFVGASYDRTLGRP